MKNYIDKTINAMDKIVNANKLKQFIMHWCGVAYSEGFIYGLAEEQKLRIKIRRKAIELYQRKLKEKQGQLHNGHFTEEILEETLRELK